MIDTEKKVITAFKSTYPAVTVNVVVTVGYSRIGDLGTSMYNGC